jgi:hypothetical protein
LLFLVQNISNVGMNTQPLTSLHRKSRVEADKYLWHLRPPWKDKFDHDHWWIKGQQEVNQCAAVWEVMRRHPRTKMLLSKEAVLYQEAPEIEFYMAFDAHKSWPRIAKLDFVSSMQQHWSESLSELPPEWGVCRHDFNTLTIIEDQVIKDLGRRYWKTFSPTIEHKPEDHKALDLAEEVWNKSGPRPGGFGGGANFDAFCALSLGRILIGFDPTRPGIEKVVQKKVREIITNAKTRSGTDSVAGRSFWKAWLNVIAEFERAESARNPKQKRDDQLFARYRRVIGGRPWPT